MNKLVRKHAWSYIFIFPTLAFFALFTLIPVGTRVRLVNEPVKVAWVEGQLFLEAHPPVDAEGQSIEPDLQLLSQKLDQALGNDTAAIHWDLARTTLQAASGIPTLVGLAADNPDQPGVSPPSAAAAPPAAAAAPPAAGLHSSSISSSSSQ